MPPLHTPHQSHCHKPLTGPGRSPIRCTKLSAPHYQLITGTAQPLPPPLLEKKSIPLAEVAGSAAGPHSDSTLPFLLSGTSLPVQRHTENLSICLRQNVPFRILASLFTALHTFQSSQCLRLPSHPRSLTPSPPPLKPSVRTLSSRSLSLFILGFQLQNEKDPYPRLLPQLGTPTKPLWQAMANSSLFSTTPPARTKPTSSSPPTTSPPPKLSLIHI